MAQAAESQMRFRDRIRSDHRLRPIVRWLRRAMPLLVSAGLLTWLIWTTTPARLIAALHASPWPWLVLLTVAQFVVLCLWDTVSVWWLFSQPDSWVPFRVVLRARTDSLHWSAVNLEIGQAMFGAKLAVALGSPVTEMLARCVVLGFFDCGTLMTLGLFGSFLVNDPIIAWLRWICVSLVGGLLTLAVLLRFLPQRLRSWLIEKPWGNWIGWWRWRHTILLMAQRTVMFLLMLLYMGIGLAICEVPVDVRSVLGKGPFVLVMESVPGTGGVGPRETGLVYLFDGGGQRAVLLSFGLIWSTVVILGRVAVGLVSSYLPHTERPP